MGAPEGPSQPPGAPPCPDRCDQPSGVSRQGVRGGTVVSPAAGQVKKDDGGCSATRCHPGSLAGTAAVRTPYPLSTQDEVSELSVPAPVAAQNPRHADTGARAATFGELA